MPFKKKKSLKRFKPKFRRYHKKFPLYKKIGKIWGQKTHYMKMDARIFLNLPKLSIQSNTGAYANRVQGDMCSMQYCFAFSMTGMLWDVYPYFDSNPFSTAGDHKPTESPAVNRAASTMTGALASTVYEWEGTPPIPANQSNNYKLDDFLLKADNYWVMQEDFRLETDYQATKLVACSFWTTGGLLLGVNNVTVRYYFATDTNLISFNKSEGMQNGQRDLEFCNYLDTFKNVTEYSPEITNKKSKKIRMRNPAPLSGYNGGMFKLMGIGNNASQLNQFNRGTGFVYLIIAINTIYPFANCAALSLNIGQLTVTKHIAYTKSHSYKVNPGQIKDGSTWVPDNAPGLINNPNEISQKTARNKVDIDFEKMNIATL